MSVDDLDRALAGVDRLLLDSSSLIAFHSPSERTHRVADHLLRRIERSDDPLRGYVLVVSACELLVRPIRTSQDDFTFMHAFLTGYPNLVLLPVDLMVATQAATLRAAARLALPDAIVVASGLLSGCQAIVSNDRRWQQRGATSYSQFRWIYLDNYV